MFSRSIGCFLFCELHSFTLSCFFDPRKGGTKKQGSFPRTRSSKLGSQTSPRRPDKDPFRVLRGGPEAQSLRRILLVAALGKSTNFPAKSTTARASSTFSKRVLVSTSHFIEHQFGTMSCREEQTESDSRSRGGTLDRQTGKVTAKGRNYFLRRKALLR